MSKSTLHPPFCECDNTVADSLAHLAASQIALSPSSPNNDFASNNTVYAFPWHNPRASCYRRTIAAALLLTISGFLFACAALSALMATADRDSDTTRFICFLAVAALTLAPGGYVLHHAWHALTNRPGYSMDMIPSYDNSR